MNAEKVVKAPQKPEIRKTLAEALSGKRTPAVAAMNPTNRQPARFTISVPYGNELPETR